MLLSGEHNDDDEIQPRREEDQEVAECLPTAHTNNNTAAIDSGEEEHRTVEVVAAKASGRSPIG